MKNKTYVLLCLMMTVFIFNCSTSKEFVAKELDTGQWLNINGPIWILSTSAENPEVMYACSGKNICRSDNRGLDWTKFTAPKTFVVMSTDIKNPNVVFAAPGG
ncbi:hypothetical protein ACFL7D_00180 [candidate division KSB1 bacterium]